MPKAASAGRKEPRGKPGALSPTSSRRSASRATRTSSCICRCATRTTRASSPLAELHAGETAQAEGTVVNTDIQYRPRRQLVCLLEDEDGARRSRAQLVLRFFSFYPNQQKALAPGNRVRVFGEVRDGHFGLEIVHPQFKVVAPRQPLPDRLTPVYPTTAGLGQDTLRKVIARALAADPARTAETLPDGVRARDAPVEVRRRGAFPARAAAAPAAPHATGARRAHASGVDAPQVRRARSRSSSR